MKSRPNSNYILDMMRDGDIGHDPWGTAMEWAFAIAECLTVINAEVPEELEYSPSPFVLQEGADTFEPESYADDVVWQYLGYESGLILSRVEEVQFAGRCLARYIDWCKAAGKSY